MERDEIEVGLKIFVQNEDKRNWQKIDFENYEYVTFRTKEKVLLKTFTYVDIDCMRKFPLMGLKESNCIRIGNSLVFMNVLFKESEKAQFENCEGLDLEFVNCVFECPIQFTSSCRSLFFDNCISKKLTITNPTTEWITIMDSYFGELNLHNLSEMELEKVAISNCKIDDLFFCNVISKIFEISGNEIGKFCVSNQSFFNFDYKQLNCLKRNLNITLSSLKKMISYNTKSKERTIESLNFIESLDCIQENPVICSKIDYLKNKLLPVSWYQRIILEFFGYFMMPNRVIFVSLCLFLFYATLYCVINGDISKPAIYLHYLEYSFNAFFSNNGENLCRIERLFSYSENLIGFLQLNAFTVSLAKKYLK